MANPIPQPVVVVATLAAFQSSNVAAYAQGGAQVAYLQGTITELDGGQGFYQRVDNDFTSPSNPPTLVVDGGGNRWAYANVSLTAAAIIALLTGTPLPIVAGGTGQANAGAALDALTIQGANIAAAATTNLATATGEFVVVTGNGGPITAMGTATAGIWRFVRFTGTPTLTHDGTSLILPGAANITVAAGDTAMFMSLGSGNWQCLFYTEISGGTVGTLPVSQGGTGAVTLTGVLKGNGTSPFTASAVLAVADGGTGVSSQNWFTSVATQVFTSNGTYTPTAGMKYCIIECVGGGGGGGGVTSSAGNNAAGGGGGAGGYSRKVSTAAIIGASQVVTIGPLGAAGTSGANNGSAGGDTSVGSICIAKGGSGGIGASSSIGAGGAGGVAGTGDFTPTGARGQPGPGFSTGGLAAGFSGGGGANGPFGGGGAGGQGGAGGAATNYGAGGGGGQVGNSSVAGGNGSAGVVIITEYI